MTLSIANQFYQFVISNQQPTNEISPQVTVDRVHSILYNKLIDQYPESQAFDNDFFKQSLREVASVIITVVYRKQIGFISNKNLVSFVSILQHLIHDANMNLPKQIEQRLQRYTHSLIVMQDIQTIRNIHEDSLNSIVVANFYQQLFLSAYLHRLHYLSKKFGLYFTNEQIPIYLNKIIVEQKEGNLQQYDSRPTSEWIILSFIYYILAYKHELFKQKPVLGKILERYALFRRESEASRSINGDQLCRFYNNVVLAGINRIQKKELDRMLDDVFVNSDVLGNIIVTPILGENNTVLDNISFSSSWQP